MGSLLKREQGLLKDRRSGAEGAGLLWEPQCPGDGDKEQHMLLKLIIEGEQGPFADCGSSFTQEVLTATFPPLLARCHEAETNLSARDTASSGLLPAFDPSVLSYHAPKGAYSKGGKVTNVFSNLIQV